jgi:alkylhydroperoxidase family enzyme
MRIPLISRDEQPDDVRTLVDLATPADGIPPHTISVLAHQPALLGPFLTWAAALALNGVLPKRDHELLALRTAHRCHSTFEWDEHVEQFAAAAGLSTDDVGRVQAGPDAFSGREQALLRAADELHDGNTILDGTWAELATHYDEGALVEIVYVVGQYTMLSLVANALAIT